MESISDISQPWAGQKDPHLNPWDQLNPRDYPSHEMYLEHKAGMQDFSAPDEPLYPPHSRTAQELAKPSSEIVILSMDKARFAYLNTSKGFDEIDFFQTAIRGTEFHRQQMLKVNMWGENFLELIPEPANEVDSNALAVDLQGRRIGYISASIASFLQGMILSLRQSGKRVYTPGYVYKPSNGIIVLPTISKMKQLLQEESALTVEEFWKMLPADFHQKVFDNNYHFDRETATTLLSYQKTAPLLVPFNSNEPEEAIPILWSAFLGDLRKAHKKAENLKRLRRNKEMMCLSESGLSYRQIGEKYGLKASTVGNIIRDLRSSDPKFSQSKEVPIKKKNSTVEAKNALKGKRNEEARSRLVRNENIIQLNEKGLTHREIGELVGLKRDTVKKIIQSARAVD